MKKEKEIVIKIMPDGKIHLDAENFEGEGCAEAIQHYIDALGTEEKSKEKPEYKNKCKVKEQQKEKN